MDLIGKNIVVYDLETKNSPDQCGGWTDYEGLGISVGCAFDYRSNRFRVFMDDNLGELVDRLNEEGTVIVAFNHISFDNRLLRGNGYALKPESVLQSYDMVVQSREGAAVNQFKPGFKLQDHLIACGLPVKTGHGADAPFLYQAGKLGTLIDYCLSDVTQERALFEYMQTHGLAKSAYRPSGYKIKTYTEIFKQEIL